MIINLFPTEASIVDKVAVQVSEYSERNGGGDDTFYIVEVVFPDGKWVGFSHHRMFSLDIWWNGFVRRRMIWNRRHNFGVEGSGSVG